MNGEKDWVETERTNSLEAAELCADCATEESPDCRSVWEGPAREDRAGLSFEPFLLNAFFKTAGDFALMLLMRPLEFSRARLL